MLDLYYERQQLIATPWTSKAINKLNEAKRASQDQQDQMNNSKNPIGQKGEIFIAEAVISMARLPQEQNRQPQKKDDRQPQEEDISLPQKDDRQPQKDSRLPQEQNCPSQDQNRLYQGQKPLFFEEMRVEQPVIAKGKQLKRKQINHFARFNTIDKKITGKVIETIYKPQFVGYYCFKSVCTWMRILFPVLTSLFDGLSDIIYLIHEWDNISTPELKSTIIFFTFNYIIVMSLVLLYLDMESNSAKCPYILFFLPVYPIFVALRMYEIVRAMNKELREINLVKIKQQIAQLQKEAQENTQDQCGQLGNSRQILVNKTWQVLYFTALFSLLQSIPQIIVQSINNNINEEWNSVSLLSFVCSLMAIVFSFIQISGEVIDVTQEHGQNHYNICFRMTWDGPEIRMMIYGLLATFIGLIVSITQASHIGGEMSAVLGFVAVISSMFVFFFSNCCVVLLVR